MARRRLVPVMVALATFAAASVFAAVPASAAPLYQSAGATSLPDGFGDIAVDPATRRVFVSSPSSNKVTVLSGDGNDVGAISVPGAGSLLVDDSKLYVAATTAGRIDVFDTATLRPAGSLGAGGLPDVASLTMAGGRLWATTGVCGAGTRLVSIDLTSATVTGPAYIEGLFYCSLLFSNPARPNMLMGFDAGLSPVTLVRLDVSSGVPVVTGSLRADFSNGTAGAFLSDGSLAVAGGGWPAGSQTFDVDTLTPTGVYYAGADDIAMDATPAGGGLVAVGSSARVVVFRVGEGAPTVFLHGFESAANRVLAGGLAFSSDGSRLYVVSGDRSTGKATLNVFGPVDPGGRYTPLTPARILDTRTGVGGLPGPVGPGVTVDMQVTGRGGIPAAGVSAIAMNVTVTSPTTSGYLTIYPAGVGRPLAANVNFTPGQTVPNLVVVKVGTAGRVAVFNSSGSTEVIFDVAGYYSEAGTGSASSNVGRYTALQPARILDTRTGLGGGVRLGAGASLDLQVGGRGGVPVQGAAAAVLNVAATGTTAISYLTVHPAGEPRPLAANVNFTPGDTVSNRAFVKLGAGGKVTVYNNAGAADVVIDVGGWFSGASATTQGGDYTALTPARILDTRDYMDGTYPRPAGETFLFGVAGQGGVPPVGATAAVLNVTVVDADGPGYFTLYPLDTALPLASDLNFAAGETRANLAVVQLGAMGAVELFISAGGHVVIDVAGWIG